MRCDYKEENKMSELIPTQQNEEGSILVTGRDLHDFLEVRTEYRKWINRMFEYGFTENIDYQRVTQKSPTLGGIQEITNHHLKLDMAKEISMLQRNKKGKQARQYFIEVEKRWNSPEMIVQRAMEIQQRKVTLLEQQIEEDKRYTNFGKVVEISESSINVGAFAKLMYEKHGFNIGRNKLMAWLRDEGYLIKQEGRERNFPKQRYIEQGLFELKPTIVKRTDGDIQSGTPMITGKGQVKLSELLLEEFKKGDAS